MYIYIFFEDGAHYKNTIYQLSTDGISLFYVNWLIKEATPTLFFQVYADSTKSFCIAAVCPLLPALQELAHSLAIDSSLSVAELCANKALVAEVLKVSNMICMYIAFSLSLAAYIHICRYIFLSFSRYRLQRERRRALCQQDNGGRSPQSNTHTYIYL